MNQTQSKTRTLAIHREIRDRILSGEYQPGERLSPAELSKALGVSLSIVREALVKLSGERLVVSLPQQGFSVPILSAEHFSDLTNVRIDIECLALRRSIERGDMEWEMRLVAAHHRLENTPVTDRGDPTKRTNAYSIAHENFHAVLTAACGSPILLELQQSLFDASELYRNLAYHLDRGPSRDRSSEHRALFEASIARETERATAFLADHYRTTERILVASGLLKSLQGSGGR